MIPDLLYRREYDASELTRRHPPHWFDRNKVAIHERLEAALPPPAGPIVVTIFVRRWLVKSPSCARSGRS